MAEPFVCENCGLKADQHQGLKCPFASTEFKGVVHNARGDDVHFGMHQCSLCEETYVEKFMIYTEEPKLCLACYYDL